MNNKHTPDVYVIGEEGDIAKMWKNGVVEKLLDDTYEVGDGSVFITNNGDKYVAGSKVCSPELWNRPEYNCAYYSPDGTQPSAELWKNDVAQNLTKGDKIGEALAVFVTDDGDVYVLGHEDECPGDWAGSDFVTKIWKNGVEQSYSVAPPDGSCHAVCRSQLFVYGNDVYVVGQEWEYEWIDNEDDSNIKIYAVLWKNGVVQRLSDGTLWADAIGVFVK